MTAEKCNGFIVFPYYSFYAIQSNNWKMFFNTNDTEDTLRMTADSIIVHVWNKKSSNQRIKKGYTKSAYEVIASQNCPTVYQSSGDEF